MEFIDKNNSDRYIGYTKNGEVSLSDWDAVARFVHKECSEGRDAWIGDVKYILSFYSPTANDNAILIKSDDYMKNGFTTKPYEFIVNSIIYDIEEYPTLSCEAYRYKLTDELSVEVRDSDTPHDNDQIRLSATITNTETKEPIETFSDISLENFENILTLYVANNIGTDYKATRPHEQTAENKDSGDKDTAIATVLKKKKQVER